MTQRDRILKKLFELGMSGSVAAANLFLRNIETKDDQSLTTGQTIALVRDHMKNLKKISPDQPGSQRHQHSSN